MKALKPPLAILTFICREAVLAERRDAGLIKLARTILSKRFGAKRQIGGNVSREAVLAERRDAGLIKLARTILLKRFGAKRQIRGNVSREARARRAA